MLVAADSWSLLVLKGEVSEKPKLSIAFDVEGVRRMQPQALATSPPWSLKNCTSFWHIADCFADGDYAVSVEIFHGPESIICQEEKVNH